MSYEFNEFLIGIGSLISTAILLTVFLGYYLRTIAFYLSKSPILCVLLFSVEFYFVMKIANESPLYSTTFLIVMIFISIFIFVISRFVLSNYFRKISRENHPIKVRSDYDLERTDDILKKINSYLENGKKSVYIQGGWGTGKTYLLNCLYNSLLNRTKPFDMTNPSYIPMYFGLDQINPNEKLVDLFRKKLTRNLYAETGIDFSFNTGQFIKSFTNLVNNNPISTFFSFICDLPIFWGESNLYKIIAEIPSLRNIEWIIIIDDLDRAASFSEIKGMLEFINYIMENSEIKVIFAADNEQVSRLIGYYLMRNNGMAHVNRIANKNTGEAIFDLKQQMNLLGLRYLSKYYDSQISLPILSDKFLTKEFLKKLPSIGISQEYVDATEKLGNGISFDGDIRLLDKIESILINTNLDLINKKKVSLNDVIGLICYFVQYPYMYPKFIEKNIVVSDNDLRIGGVALKSKGRIFEDSKYEYSLLNPLSTDYYVKFFKNKVIKRHLESSIYISG